MEQLLIEEFKCREVRSCGSDSGGCISSGSVFSLDGRKVFVKRNPSVGSRTMFDGEYASLVKLSEAHIFRVPNPIKVFSRAERSFLVMEHLAISSLHKQASNLGAKLAQLHLYNENLKNTVTKNQSFVGKSSGKYVDSFGFDMTTCCGFIPMNNEWKKDWLQFYAINRLQPQIEKVTATYQNREVLNLWHELVTKLPNFFPNDFKITPSLLHGDFWVGNTGEVGNEPCVFDPACSYGHSEFDLALAHLIGGFPSDFHNAYHKILPKREGFENRIKLYKLFYNLNHWNHFGSGYKSSSISLMHEILKL
ncbi:unnamed protein product [Clavelina lepadiformis]|uniref:protein-ribulosamine 3-kinase n=1 Tax=Clavelina lepadiformis TaxID=159417 RepID=A0ABP0G2E6_CLALP